MLLGSSIVASSGCGKASEAAREAPMGGSEPCRYCGEAGESGLAAGAGGAPGAVVGGGGGEDSGEDAGQGGGPPAAPPPELVLSAVTISQTLELPLMKVGHVLATEERGAPLIAGKRALVRAFVELGPSFQQRPLLGVLDVKTPLRTRSLVSERTVTATSSQDDLASTFVFEVSAEDLGPTTEYRVRVLEADTTPLARFPEQGYTPFAAQPLSSFKLTVVPFWSNGFGPKTDDAELAGLRRRILALYPSSDVEITLGKAVQLPYVVDADGGGWDDALDLIYALRSKAAPAADVFYYGLMAPAKSYDAYCPESCVLGFSTIADADDADARGSIGIGVFEDGSGAKDAGDTMVHELGHALGRDHAPCGILDPTDIDPEWPKDPAHAKGLIGRYGYDFELGRLVKPRPAKDVMSYCTPTWISDYTYAGITERLQAIGLESQRALSAPSPPRFRLARIRRTGQSIWLEPRNKNGTASPQAVPLLDATGRVVRRVTAQVARVDHGRGGYVWLPEAELAHAGAVSVDLRPLGGSVLAL